MVDGNPARRGWRTLPGIRPRRGVAAAGTADTVCGLCGVAERVSGRKRDASGGRILEGATARRGGVGTADRSHETGDAEPSRRVGEGRTGERVERRTEEVEPERRSDAVHGADGGLQGAPDEVQRRGGCGGRDGDREPGPERDRRIDRILRQYTGAEDGPERESEGRGVGQERERGGAWRVWAPGGAIREAGGGD